MGMTMGMTMGMPMSITMYIIVAVIVVVLLLAFFWFHILSPKNENSKPVPLFWTGGYDSTYRLCELLFIEKRIVQPVYISANIDNEPGESTRRHNHRQEIAAMDKIRKEIVMHNESNLEGRFLPTIIIPEVILPDSYKAAMLDLYNQNLVRRPTCQYGALAYIADRFDRMGKYAPAEICVENEPSSKLHRAIYPLVLKNPMGNLLGMAKDIAESTLNFIGGYEAQKGMHIFKRINFSTIHKSKQTMLNIAKKYNFQHILNLTWSCWYPINNKPCNKCIMCRERII